MYMYVWRSFTKPPSLNLPMFIQRWFGAHLPNLLCNPTNTSGYTVCMIKFWNHWSRWNCCRSTTTSLATTSRSATSGGRQRASSSSQRGASKSGTGGGRTRARKRKRGAESAAQDGGSGGAESAAQNEGDAESAQTGDTGNEGEQRPPPRKKRAYRRRSQMQHGTSSYGQGSASVARQTTTTAHTTVNNGVGAVPEGHSDDMMQLTEQFAQQHYRNIVSQTTQTLHLLSQQQQQQQQLAAYVPTSRSYLGIPIFVERDDAPASSIIHRQAQQLPESSSTTGQRTLSLLSTSHQLTRPSPTCTCASITSPSLSVSGAMSTTASQLTGVQVLPPPGLHMPHLHAYPLAAPSYALPFQGVYSFPQTSTPALTQSSQLQSSFPTTVSHNHSSAIAHPAHPHTLPSTPSTSSSLATASSSAAEVVDFSSSSQSISLSSTAPIVSSQSQLHDSSLATDSSSAAEIIDSSSSSQSTCISLSSTAPIVSSQSQLHVTYSFPRTQISQPYPATTTTTTEISPPTSMVSSPTVSASPTEASQSQDSTRGQEVSQGQTSVRNQAPTDEVVFPKGPSFITLVRHPGTVASLNRLKTVSSRSSSRSSSSSSSRRPNTSSGASSYVQPHASLLAPEFRQGNLSSVETATVRASASTGTSSTSVTTCTPTCTSARSSTSTTSVHETRPLIIGSAPHLSRRFGDIPYPSLGPRSLPPRSVSFTSVTDDSMPTRPWTPGIYHIHVHVAGNFHLEKMFTFSPRDFFFLQYGQK